MSFRLALLSILVVSIIDAKIVPRSQGIPIPSWDCPPLPTPPPATNVNQLRPGVRFHLLIYEDPILIFV